MATAKKTAVTKKATPAKWEGITAYCVKTKERDVPMLEAVVDIQNGRYIAKGLDADGNKLTSIMSKVNAEAQIAAGNAKGGVGFKKAK